MKTRRGFVSNSSTSSFVVISQDIDFHSIDENNLEDIYGVGGEWGEGCDFFELDSAMYDFLKEHFGGGYQTGEIDFIKVYGRLDGEGELVDPQEITDMLQGVEKGEKVKFNALEVSYHSSNDVMDIEDRYFSDIPDPEENARDEVEVYLSLTEKASTIDEDAMILKKRVENLKKKIDKDPLLTKILKEKKSDR